MVDKELEKRKFENDIRNRCYENAKKLCEERGISIASLESQADIANGTIGKWREKIPKITTLVKAANFLDVPVSSFVKETNAEQTRESK